MKLDLLLITFVFCICYLSTIHCSNNKIKTNTQTTLLKSHLSVLGNKLTNIFRVDQ